MYDEVILRAFLDNQEKLYPEPVAGTMEEAEDFLIDTCAAVADAKEDVIGYLDDVGVDIEGMSESEIFELPEIIAVGDGRYLILEI